MRFVSESRRAAAVERLCHMAEAADAIAGYVGRGRAAFDTDPAIRDAILYQIIFLGEAAKAARAADPSLEASHRLSTGHQWRVCATVWRTLLGDRRGDRVGDG